MIPQRNALARRGYLGFQVLARPGQEATARERWIVSKVDAGSPAELAGLMVGDDIGSLDGAELSSLAMLRERAAGVVPGTLATLGISRHGRPGELAVRAASMPLETLDSGRIELGEVPWCHQGQVFRLRAVWTVPEGAARAALWLLPSAAWVSQECPLSPEDPTFQLVSALTARGVTTLRVDRSGLGDSEGPAVTELDFHAEMSMWEAARCHFLEAARSAGVPRFLFGRSLGGMLAPLIATGHTFAGVVVWGTSSEPWHEASMRSTERQARLRGKQGTELEAELAVHRRLQELVYLAGLTPDEARQSAPELGARLPEIFSGSQVHGRSCKFFQQLEQADVAKAWSQVGTRVLAIHAEYDILTARSDLERIVELAGRRASFTSLPGVDHFLHARPSMLEAVRAPWGGSFSPDAARTLLEFMFEE